MDSSSEDSKDELIKRIAADIIDISGFPECRSCSRRLYNDLVRRVKLLSPLFEELMDSDQDLGDEEIQGLECLRDTLNSTKDLLRSINDGSKLFQALQIERVVDEFHNVTTRIEEALTHILYDRLDISEEVREQVELVHAQFKRAKGAMDTPDLQLAMDLKIAGKETDSDSAVVRRLSEKLYLKTINDVKRESLAIHDLVISSGGAPEQSLEMMSFLLKKIKDYVVGRASNSNSMEGDEKGVIKHRSPIIPDDFRCPISLELMKDPVIVSTGQTYERSCIQKWLDAGHKTCPKTQQTLLHTALTPNYVLKSLISLWCESNGVELPKNSNNQGSCAKKSGGRGLDCDRGAIDVLIHKLADNSNPEQQRAAAGELRLLAKRNADNRVCIADAGAIPLLVELLASPDSRTQEHSVTALLNLSINDANKGAIVNSGAISDIVDVLKKGSMEARENAAATLFSLSVVDENKVAIGAAGAIPALIELLCEGTPRGKKDAATAIFNLSIYQGNKVRAVRAGIVVPLMGLLKDAGSGMVDEALAILAILANHQEGKSAISQAEPIGVLVEVIRTGSPRNRENAAAILWSLLCMGDESCLVEARDVGAEEALKELCENGTDRAKRKAVSILELILRVVD
ncbi:U-box domain-containing protein 14 [Impatiens glandulifera]|uniref:U-box domain-containing protein 14 n=1 Tax=Impatiens glandulifera TaxID=253017 RepID=UPI001FB0F1E9|nr:U-box domain-containing protein 14 [Impatiens glandulifera]